jgi:hypothetical protein
MNTALVLVNSCLHAINNNIIMIISSYDVVATEGSSGVSICPLLFLTYAYSLSSVHEIQFLLRRKLTFNEMQGLKILEAKSPLWEVQIFVLEHALLI